tara:strand:- start:155 stop:376 length:222 start_codon:yes stop_codon:yes gene_type:complete
MATNEIIEENEVFFIAFLHLGIMIYASAAGWSSLVARQAHNLKVAGSNPAPAPKNYNPTKKKIISPKLVRLGL